MKNMKTKIGLSVLALACFGAGALTFQPNVSAYADEATVKTTRELTMNNGAEICAEADYSGIRWTTTINAGFYADASTQFGVIVAPTKNIEGELTHSTPGMKDLAFEANAIDTSVEATYYSIINYTNLGEDFDAACAVELTARAYVYVNGEYEYAALTDDETTTDVNEAVSTARSARQIAINADLSGKLDEMEAEKVASVLSYYGATERYNFGDTSKYYVDDTVTVVVDAEALAANGSVEVTLDLGTASFVEAVVGAEKVNATYADGKLTVTDLDYVADGEGYLTIFTDNGFVVKPFIKATKVIDSAEDLQTFRAKGTKGVESVKVQETKDDVVNKYFEDGKWSANQEFPGYYVVGKSFNARYLVDGKTKYQHGSMLEDGTSFNDVTWNGADAYVGKPIGLTGTFNGMGHDIKDLVLGSKNEGLFGIVNGGTVKNVAITNLASGVKAAQSVLAHYLVDATVENVYIQTNKNMDGSGYGVSLSSYGYATEKGANKISNLVFEITQNKNATVGGLFSTAKAADQYTFENVYVISTITGTAKYIGYTVTPGVDDEATPDVDESQTNTYAYVSANILPMAYTKSSKFKVETNKLTLPAKGSEKGTFAFAENQVTTETVDEQQVTKYAGVTIDTDIYNIIIYKNVFTYTNATDFNAGVLASNKMDKFSTACWTVNATTGAVVWTDLLA